MATTINQYSVGLRLDAKQYINSSKLSAAETRRLSADINKARSPMDKFVRDQERINSALQKGAIDQRTHARLIQSSAARHGVLNKQVKQSNFEFQAFASKVSGSVVVALTTYITTAKKAWDVTRQLQGEIDKTAKAATKLGATFDELQGLRLAGAELAGVDDSQIDRAARRVQINLAKAVAGDTALQETFQRLGVDASRALASGPLEAIKAIAEGMQGIETQAERLQVADKLFGRAGAEIVGMLQSGADAIQEAADFQAKWGSLTDAQVISVETLNDMLGRGTVAMDGLKNIVAAELAPAMITLVEEFGEFENLSQKARAAAFAMSAGFASMAGMAKDVMDSVSLTVKIMQAAKDRDFFNLSLNVAKASAMEFDGAKRGFDKFMANRARFEEEASKKAEQRELERAKIVQEAMSEATETQEETIEKSIDMFERQANAAMKAAEQHFEQERRRAMKIRQDLAAGPGTGMEAGGADAVRFMAQQQNAAIAAAVMPNQPTPGEDEILREAKKQFIELRKIEQKQERQVETLREMLAVARQNGFRRID